MEKIKLGDLCKPSAGQIKEDEDTLIDYIDISSVDNETKKVTGYQTITFGEAPSRARKAVRRGNVLVSTVRPNLNAVALLEEDTPNVSVASTGFCVLESKDDVDPRFILNFCKSKPFIDDMVSQATGASYPAVSDKIVRSALVPKYSYQEQQHISTVLDKLAGIIDDRRIELQQLDDLIKARFVEIFGLPVSNSKGWPTEPLNDVAPAVNYSGEFGDEVWLLNLDMVEAQTGRILDYLMVTNDEIGNSTCTFDESNVLYSKLRPYLNKVVIPDRCGYATSELVPLQPVKTKLNREYLAFMLRSEEFVNMITEKAAGAKMPRVSMGDFRKFDVPIPPLDLQNQFAEFVKQVDKSKVVA